MVFVQLISSQLIETSYENFPARIYDHGKRALQPGINEGSVSSTHAWFYHLPNECRRNALQVPISLVFPMSKTSQLLPRSVPQGKTQLSGHYTSLKKKRKCEKGNCRGMPLALFSLS